MRTASEELFQFDFFGSNLNIHPASLSRRLGRLRLRLCHGCFGFKSFQVGEPPTPSASDLTVTPAVPGLDLRVRVQSPEFY